MYQSRIASLLNPAEKLDPRHIEAYMRVGCTTLDGLSARQFAHEVVIARQCVRDGDPALTEYLARSYGL